MSATGDAETITCPGCLGRGDWFSECCDGSGGCSCGGRVVPMGTCLICRGTGKVVGGEYDEMANVKSITGLCFLGTGPRSGIFAGASARGMVW